MPSTVIAWLQFIIKHQKLTEIFGFRCSIWIKCIYYTERPTAWFEQVKFNWFFSFHVWLKPTIRKIKSFFDLCFLFFSLIFIEFIRWISIQWISSIQEQKKKKHLSGYYDDDIFFTTLINGTEPHKTNLQKDFQITIFIPINEYFALLLLLLF